MPETAGAIRNGIGGFILPRFPTAYFACVAQYLSGAQIFAADGDGGELPRV